MKSYVFIKFYLSLNNTYRPLYRIKDQPLIGKLTSRILVRLYSLEAQKYASTNLNEPRENY